MKTINKILFILLLAVSAQAQFYFKVQPKSFLSMKGDTTTIVGIKASFIGNLDLSLTEDTLYNRTFYISFVTDEGNQINAFNTTSQLIVDDMIKAGATQSQAIGQMNAIIKELTFGTRLKKYQQAQLLAYKYGYGLLPLNQQNE